MSKKSNKNNNYVTEKTTAAKLAKEKDKKARKTKKIVKQIVVAVLALAIIAGAFTGLGFAFGWFDYAATPTYHASIEVEGYGTLHVELYGNEAPESVNAFVELAKDKHYDGASFDSLFGKGGARCTTDKSNNNIEVRYNCTGENKITFGKGMLGMIPSDDGKSTGDFFINGKRDTKLDDSYAVFGRVTDESHDLLEDILRDIEKNGAKPKIKSITVHESH